MSYTLNTFKVYDDEFQSGLSESIMQQTNAFNQASAGAITLVPSLHRGEFAREAFFKEIQGIIRGRNPGSTSSDSDDDLAQEELVMPKLNRKYQVAKTMDAFRKILPADNPESVFSLRLGEQIGPAIAADYLNTGLRALVGAVAGNADVIKDVSAESNEAGLTNYKNLVETLARFGDASNDIIAFVMHSKTWHDLLGQSVGVVTDRVAGAAIWEGIAGSLGRPVIVTDSPALTYVEDYVTKYRTFGLQANGLSVLESEGGIMTPVTDVITGEENLRIRIQGEHAYNIRTRGYSWTGTSNGTLIANPSDAQLANDANFTKVATDKKSTAGVLLISK
jgi:hypothetical protein